MASSSTSSIQVTSFKYDVFFSFRGEDTRTNFVDHLYDALKRQNIETYKDDKNLQKGNKISNELIKAIEESRFHVIVFSKNYASSSWCLDELNKIMECRNMQIGHTVYPIFYDVEPTQVRKQSGEFGKAFSKQENDEAAEKWRKALVEAASLSGWDLRTTADGHEAEFIQRVVKDISSKLPAIHADDNLIGMRTRVNDVVSYLNASPDEFCMIGIWGMGGGGKTTLARAVFDQIRNEFEGASFVENVREVSNIPVRGLKSLQQQVLRDMLNTKDITVTGVLEGKTMMKKKMPGKKILVVLDDVDHIDQLKALAGEPNWFKPGSKIIITTRDKQVLVAHGVKLIHHVNLLTDDEAMCLLSRCAFGRESPSPSYEELSVKVVRYAAGLPLTITVLGSSLCGADEHVWMDTLKRLDKIPLGETLQKLELSYIDLPTDCKEIFLDVACILKGRRKDEAIRVLESCGFHAIHGLSVLEKKSLITISKDYRLNMHDHIQEMGRDIVRRLHPDEPNKHSRLWIKDEVIDILANNRGTEATTCVSLFAFNWNLKHILKGFGKMEKLRLLLMYSFYKNSNSEIDEVSQYFPNSLQYLKCDSYPFCSLPKTFQANNLVALEMHYNRMEQLWEGGERKVLHKLRFLDLSYSELRTLDLGLTPNLEKLNITYCNDLVELHIPVGCPKLKSLAVVHTRLSTLDLTLIPNIETLNLYACELVELDMPCTCSQLKSLNLSSPRLRSLNLGLTPNIETLNLIKCDELVELGMPRECPQLKSLNLSSPRLRSLNLGLTPNIETLNLVKCDELVELGMPRECPQLKSLNLSSPRLRSLNLGLTPNIETLNLVLCDELVELGIPRECPQLKSLNLSCRRLRSHNCQPNPNIKTLKRKECDYLVELDMFLQCPQLKSIDLKISKLRTLGLGPTPNLETLKLQGCYNLVELRMHDECCKLKTLSLECSQFTFDRRLTLNLKTLILDGHDDLVELISDGCPQLEYLRLINSKLRTLELTLNLKTLILEECNLVELHIPDDGDVKLESLQIKRCSELKTLDLGRTPNLESLWLDGCSSLVKVHAPVGGLKKLIDLDAHLHGKLVNICPLHPENKDDLPSSIENIEKLISQGFSCACTDLESFFGSICGLQHLTNLSLVGSISKVPKDLDQLQYLEELTLMHTKIKRLPDSICMLKYLKSLKLYYCKLLEKLPKDLGQLECLENLILLGCIVLQDIPKSICRMKSLKFFSVLYCDRVKELPEELGRLECLIELDIRGTHINNLPPSISLLKDLQIFRSEDGIPTTTTSEGCSEDEIPTTTTSEGCSEDEIPTTTTSEGCSEDEIPTTTTSEGCCTVL